MNEATRTTVGYAALGLVIGVLLYPWVYLVSVRTDLILNGYASWVYLFFAVVLGPAALLGLLGWSRGRAAQGSV